MRLRTTNLQRKLAAKNQHLKFVPLIPNSSSSEDYLNCFSFQKFSFLYYLFSTSFKRTNSSVTMKSDLEHKRLSAKLAFFYFRIECTRTIYNEKVLWHAQFHLILQKAKWQNESSSFTSSPKKNHILFGAEQFSQKEEFLKKKILANTSTYAKFTFCTLFYNNEIFLQKQTITKTIPLILLLIP